MFEELFTCPNRLRGDALLVRRAVREGWLTEEQKPVIAQRLCDVALAQTCVRRYAAAAKALTVLLSVEQQKRLGIQLDSAPKKRK